MKLKLTSEIRQDVFQQVSKFIGDAGLKITKVDSTRPWGGFLVLDEDQAAEFTRHFLPDEKLADLYIGNKLSPKILLVQPHKRLSWQYHHRRAEIWRVIGGEVGVVTSMDDSQGAVVVLRAGDTIRLAQGQRHRLVGLEGWGILAEIWQHTDPSNPSDEEDIVRVEDDFGR